MREAINGMQDRILSVLKPAGRNKRQINRHLSQLETEIRQQTGEKQVKWTEEYYCYLLEVYLQAIDLAVEESVIREEYEWASALTARKQPVTDNIDALSSVLQ